MFLFLKIFWTDLVLIIVVCECLTAILDLFINTAIEFSQIIIDALNKKSHDIGKLLEFAIFLDVIKLFFNILLDNIVDSYQLYKALVVFLIIKIFIFMIKFDIFIINSLTCKGIYTSLWLIFWIIFKPLISFILYILYLLKKIFKIFFFCNILSLIFIPLINSTYLLSLNAVVNKKSLKIFIYFFLFLWIVSLYSYFFHIFFLISKKFTFTLILFKWINLEYVNIYWGITINNYIFLMLFIIINISTIIHLYSLDYMKHDVSLIKFLAYLSLFTFFMIILVVSPNFLQLFIGWEGVGLCSYLLVNFWYNRLQANKSALKALFLNKIGDVFLLLAIILIYLYYNTLTFEHIYLLTPFLSSKIIYILNFKFYLLDVICFFLMISAIIKSAQIGLHIWLPDAMEGPTPVSALLHSATMVTAGIFLIIKCSILFEYSPYILYFISVFGILTAILSGFIGFLQYDIKKIIAYSTCSQLGFMFFTCGISNYSLSFFHLLNHAFFKALLFLGAGSIIHGLLNEQDIRKMGGLLYKFPITYITMFIASLSLMGIPFFSGYYSKDFILESNSIIFSSFNFFIYWFGLSSSFFTSFYSIRLLYYVFYVTPNFNKKIIYTLHESGFFIIFSLIFLCFFSIFSGYLFYDALIGQGSDFFQNYIFLNNFNTEFNFFLDIEYNIFLYKVLPFFFSICGILSVFLFNIIIFKYLLLDIYFKNIILNKYINLFNIYFFFYNFFFKKFYIDKIINKFINIKMLFLSLYLYKLLDKGIIEYIFPLFIKKWINKISIFIIKLHNGNIIFYLRFFIFIFIFIFIFFFLLIYYDCDYNSFFSKFIKK